MEKLEQKFEKASEFSHKILGSSVVVISVLIIISVWLYMVFKSNATLIERMRDCFIAVSFLTFFIVQRALNKYNRVVNLKLNELVRAHENASNELINIEMKTHKELDEIEKEIKP